MPIQIFNWLNNNDTQEFSYTYWNDRQKEEEKVWNVPRFGLGALNSYLTQIGLDEALEAALDKAATMIQGGLTGIGVDVACGSFWSAKILLEKTELKHLWGVDFSAHRIQELATHMVNAYLISPDRVSLALGNFYDLKFEDNSMNFILLSQALHHAEHPLDLLREAHRVLSDNGIVVVIGEKPFDFDLHKSCRKRVFEFLPERIRNALSEKAILRKLGFIVPQPPPPDLELGDHYYNFKDYENLFCAARFQFFHGISDQRHNYFLLWKNVAGNTQCETTQGKAL